MSRPRIHTNVFGKYGRLSIIEEVAGTPFSREFLCACDCGKTIVVSLNRLLSGNTKSCGCLKRDRNKRVFTKHGFSGTRLYRTWASMKDRCFREKCPAYKNYGGRGITICEEWMEFQPFYNWAMANGYQDNLTIERTDNDRDYYPENCRWIPKEDQPKNRRTLNVISFNGQTKSLSNWALKIGLSRSALKDRFKNGWSIEKALTTPKLNHRR